MNRISVYLCFLVLLLLQCDVKRNSIDNTEPYLTVVDNEIQAQVAAMTLDEKLGQLLILETELSPICNEDSIYTYVRENLISGALLYNTDAIQYMRIIDNCIALNDTRFLHGTRENVSICNQFSNTVHFPSLAAMNACSNDSLIEEAWHIYNMQLDAFNFDFAIGPNITSGTVDTKFDANNFCSHPAKLEMQARDFSNRFKTRGIFRVANQLNQFIDINKDTLGSHSDLALLDALKDVGYSGLMVGPDFFADSNFTDLPFEFLKSHLDLQYSYNGLLMASLEANSMRKLIHTGIDLILVKDVRKQTAKLKDLYERGFLTDATLNEKVARILKTKDWINEAKGDYNMDVEAANFLTHYEEYDFLVRSLQEASVVLTHNHKSLVPFKQIKKHKYTIHNLGKFKADVFNATFRKFADAQVFQRYDHVNGVLDLSSLSEDIGTTNIYLYDGSVLTEAERTELTDKLNGQQNVNSLIVNFGDPRYLAPFAKHISSMHSYDLDQYAQSAAAQLSFGAFNASARLDVAVNDFIIPSKAYNIRKIRLKFADPREVGIDPTDLVGIDAIANTAISKEAIPGCQVLVAKDGNIIYSKGFGYQTYDKINQINTANLYDLASISKIAGTTLATMKLVEDEKLNLTDRLRNLLDFRSRSSIRNIKIKDLLLHRSNLQPNMPISDFVEVDDSTSFQTCNDKFCYTKTAKHSQTVAKDFFVNQTQIDTLWDKVYGLKPYKKSKYRYSDVNFNLLHKVIENKGNQKLDNYLYNKFYDKIGLRNLGYKPTEKHPIADIVPTAFDKKWRKQVVHGYVHDEAAALQGGVAGSAGLFSNAEDLASLFQMLLNGGRYGGERFLQDGTISDFITPPYYSRRGYGFDKPRGKYTESCSSKASKLSYGHSGFTGTCVWVDPQTDLVYIFLSNRIYPSAENRKLYKEKYRGRIHTVIYNALDSYKWETPDPYQPTLVKPIQS